MLFRSRILKIVKISVLFMYALRYRETHAAGVDFLKSAKKLGLPMDKLITHTYPLEEINEALKTNLAMTGLKIAIINQ